MSRNDSSPAKSPSVGNPIENRNRGRKRKHDSGFGCNDDAGDKNDGIEVGGRVLQPQNSPTRGGMKVVHSGPTGSISGLKRTIKTEPLNQTELQKRPKRNVGYPSSLHDFYVEPSLKLTRKPKPRKLPPLRRRACMMFASGNTPETDSDEISAYTPIPESELSKVLRALIKARREKNVKVKNEPEMEMEMDSGVRLGEKSSNIIGYNYVDTFGDNFNKDTCDICGDGGQLICCDNCPATFHLSCLQFQNIPSAQWYCIYCLCKWCGCVTFDAQTRVPDPVVSCCLCDDKFHKTCIQMDAANIDSSDLSFCGKTCHQIYERLQAILGIKIEISEGFSFTLLKRFDATHDLEPNAKKIGWNSKLAVALSVVNEIFLPIVDTKSGVDVIRNVVYNCGSNFKRLNHGGFFTAIMEKDDEVISVASIRVHGKKLAEMPFIATRKIYRWQGMCRRLLDLVESILSSLGVGELVIPVIPDLLEIWTEFSGFSLLEESTRQKMKSMSIVVFPGTYMLQKHIPPNQPTNTKLGRVIGRLM